MYGSGDNYYGAMFTQMPYGAMGEGRSMLPPPPPNAAAAAAAARGPQPTPPIPVDFSTALALAAATVAANTTNNSTSGASVNGNGSTASDGQREADKLGYYAPPQPPPPQAGGDYSPSCYVPQPPPPQSNSPADFMYYPRGGPQAGGPNAFYPPTTSWPYQQDYDTAYNRAAAGAAYAATGDGAYGNQFAGRLTMNASPYMMYTNGAPGGPDDLVDRFNCVSLNEAVAAQQPFVYQQGAAAAAADALLNSQWQHLMGKVRGLLNFIAC